MGQKGITKKQSAVIQGLAVLIMMYHHFFNDPAFYGDSLSFFQMGWAQKFAWFGKICVGMFAFVSGYGMCRILEKKRQAPQQRPFFQTLGLEYGISIRQILRVLVRFWAVFLVSMGIMFALGKRQFDKREFLANFFCLESGYNGAFWYMEQYVKMMLLLPLVDLLFVKWDKKEDRLCKRFFYGGIVMLLGIWGVTALGIPAVRDGSMALLEAMRLAFVLVFFVGYCCCRFQIFEWVEDRLRGVGRAPYCVLGLVLMVAVCAVRMALSTSPSYATLDFLLMPFWIYGILCVCEVIRPVFQLLYWFGKLSTYMWLTHIFVYDITLGWLLEHVQFHLLFYGIQVILCMSVAILFRGAEYLIGNLWKGRTKLEEPPKRVSAES